MTSTQLSENIEDGIIRLKRHYQICKNGYDRAAFKDLAHTLRVWMDMKNEVDRYLTHMRPTSKFINFSILPILNRSVRDYEYVVVYFPKRVIVDFASTDFAKDLPVENSLVNITSHPQGALYAENRFDSHAPKFPILDNPFFYKDSPNESLAGVRYDGYYQFSSEYWISVAKTKTLPLNDIKGYVEFRKVKFGVWVNSIAVRINYNVDGKLVLHDISRENIIRRVANGFGASHPSGGYEIQEPVSAPINRLMEYKIFGIPTPYLILLKIAQDILNEFA